MKKRLIIIDSNYLCCVNKFALSSGLSYCGGRTEIIFGFLRGVLDFAKRFETNNFVFCWDSKESKRKEIYPFYKFKRTEKTDEQKELDEIAYSQFNKLRKRILYNLGFANVFWQVGYEADDLIASILFEHKNIDKPMVVSSDNDLFQLLEFCNLYNVMKHETMTKNIFMKIYGIKPSQWADVKTIAGCASDNVSGVIGVGEKTAIKYLKGELTKGKTFDSIVNREDDKELVKQLVTLPFPNVRRCVLRNNNFNMESYRNVCVEYGFKSFLKDKALKDWEKYIVRKGNHL